MNRSPEPSPAVLGDFTERRYRVEEAEFSTRNIMIASCIAGPLFLVFSIADYFAYRELFADFLVIRIVCATLILAVGIIAHTKWARRNHQIVDLMIPLLVGFCLSYFIYLINDPSTFYYAGLNLAIVGSATLFNRSWLISTMIITMFLVCSLPTLGKQPIHSSPVYLGNCLFLVSTAIISYLSNRRLRQIRRIEFVTRAKQIGHQHDLELTNEDLRHTQTQLFQSEKMSFFGQVAAGVIHEIGNPLNYTISALYLVRKQISKDHADPDPKLFEKLDDINDGLDRIQSIIANLQEFSHIGQNGGAHFQLSESIESALKILSGVIGKSEVDVVTDLDDSLLVLGFKNQLTQVMSNLIHNAIQAIDECDRQGHLSISLKKVDNQAEVTISDNGPGISDEALEGLFTPFFTTKAPGVGTGLGLSICFRIIESHKGEIQVDSTMAEGSKFTILLPL